MNTQSPLFCLCIPATRVAFSGRFMAIAIAVLSCAMAVQSASAAEKKTPVPKTKKNDLKPVPAGEKIVASHAPFEDGDCSLCHKNKDPKDPGPLISPSNQLCLECHEDFKQVMARKSIHAAASESCTSCHNPHNARQRKLLVEDPGDLCLSCHEEIKTLTLRAKVKHDALTTGGKCANCHNSHGANVEHLLNGLAMDLCMSCHGKDGVKDSDGKKLTNMQALLKSNPQMHGPVGQKDCSACHNPHGGENFRLLTKEYPAQFYSPYDPKLYALCFDCHEESMLTDRETTTLTQFRNGSTNLHFVH
ncbi:MAG TPA: cytochrome c3 family protein, partial [Candidatus Paceibacterota bacterium]|nr:cytochrome c3 family protein [Candidatus Paceibacterota bacterium]